MQPGIHLGAGEVGSLAVHSFQNTCGHQVGNRLPYGYPANAEPYHEGSLGGNGVARIQLARDQVLEDAADLSTFGRCRSGLAIKPDTIEITPDLLLLQCVLTAPIRSGRLDHFRAARDLAALRPVCGACRKGDNPEHPFHDLRRGMLRARPAEGPVVHGDGGGGTRVDGSRGAVLSNGDQLRAGGHELIG